MRSRSEYQPVEQSLAQQPDDEADEAGSSKDQPADCRKRHPALSRIYDFFQTFIWPLSPLEMGLICVVTILAILNGLLPAALCLMFGDFVTAMYELDDDAAYILALGSAKAFTGLAVASAIVYFGRRYIGDYVSWCVAIKYEKTFIYAYSRRPMNWRDQEANVGATAWVDLCSHGFRNAVIRGGLGFVSSTISVVGCFILLFAQSWQLALVATIGVGVVIIGFNMAERMMVDATQTFDAKFEDVSAVFHTIVNNIPFIYAFGMETVVQDNVGEMLEAVATYDHRRRASELAARGVLSLVTILVVGAAVWLCGTVLVDDLNLNISRVGGIFVSSLFAVSRITLGILEMPKQFHLLISERQRLEDLNSLIREDKSALNLFNTLVQRTPARNGGFEPQPKLAETDEISEEEKHRQAVLKHKRQSAEAAHKRLQERRRAARRKAAKVSDDDAAEGEGKMESSLDDDSAQGNVVPPNADTADKLSEVSDQRGGDSTPTHDGSEKADTKTDTSDTGVGVVSASEKQSSSAKLYSDIFPDEMRKSQWAEAEQLELDEREAARRAVIKTISHELEAQQPAASVTFNRVSFTGDVTKLRRRIAEREAWQASLLQREVSEYKSVGTVAPNGVEQDVGQNAENNGKVVTHVPTTTDSDAESLMFDDLLLLKNVSFSIEASETVALVGTSTEGIEAVLHVIFGLYPAESIPLTDISTNDNVAAAADDGRVSLSIAAVTSGTISLHLREKVAWTLDASSLDANAKEPVIKIGVLSCDRRSLFRGTVIENISLRRRGVTEADVLQVCQRVCLLKPLQEKYETGFRHIIDPDNKEEDGLSDLECSQLLLARVLVGAPSLVVLDRPLRLLSRGTLERAVMKKILQRTFGAEAGVHDSKSIPPFTTLVHFEYADDASDIATRIIAFDGPNLIEDVKVQKILAAIRNKDIDTQSWVGPQILKEKLQHFGESDRFPEPLEVLCQQLATSKASKQLNHTLTEHESHGQTTVPHVWSAKEPMNVDSIIESRTRSRSAFTRMIGKVLPKMTPQLAAGFVVAALLGVMYPAFAFLTLNAVRVVSACNPVKVPYYVDVNISIGMDISGAYDTHNVTIHDRCIDYPYLQSQNGTWSTSGTWLDHAGYSCADYESIGWCESGELSDEISIEALHVDADSDGICDVTGDNCTNPETDAVKTGRGEPFQTGSGTAWGCDCNTSLDNTGYIFDDPWFANMTCCGCGGGKMVNSFEAIVSRTRMVVETQSIVEFYANITLFGCSAQSSGARTSLDCDQGTMDRLECASRLEVDSTTALQLFIVLAILCLILWTLVGMTLGRIHSTGTMTLRKDVLRALLRQDADWHLTKQGQCRGPALNADREEEQLDASSARNEEGSERLAKRVSSKTWASGRQLDGETVSQQPGLGDSGLDRLWKDGIAEAHNMILDTILMYLQYFVGLSIAMGFMFNINWELATLFWGLQLVAWGVFVVMRTCPLYAPSSHVALKTSIKRGKELLKRVFAQQHLLNPLIKWAGESFELRIPPPTKVAIALAARAHTDAVRAARQEHAKLLEKLASRSDGLNPPADAPRIKDLVAYRPYLKQLHSGVPTDQVKAALDTNGLDAAVADMSPDDIAWPPPFSPPPAQGPPVPLLNLSRDLDDPRLPWLLQKHDEVRRPGRSQRMLVHGWDAFHETWPLTSQLSIFAVVCYYAVELIASKRSSGDAGLAIVLFGSLILRYASALRHDRELVKRGRRVLPRIFAVLDRKPFIDPQEDVDLEIDRKKMKGTISCAEASFRYPAMAEGCWGIRNVSFSVAAGDKCGVIGTERSGKTTLLHMILRLFDPSHGKVELDGISLVAFKVRELRRCFGYVPTVPTVFETSILDNITLGDNARFPLDEVQKVLTAVGLSDFVNSLPAGLNSMVAGIAGLKSLRQVEALRRAEEEARQRAADEAEERAEAARAAKAAGYDIEEGPANEVDEDDGPEWAHGQFVRLSTFQRQQIALARAMLRKPHVYLFDAVLRHVESEEEKLQLQNIMDRISDMETVFTVSDTIRDVVAADKILVMHRGAVVEQGRHVDMLLEGRELYTSLCTAQNVSTNPDNVFESDESSGADGGRSAKGNVLDEWETVNM